MRRQA